MLLAVLATAAYIGFWGVFEPDVGNFEFRIQSSRHRTWSSGPRTQGSNIEVLFELLVRTLS